MSKRLTPDQRPPCPHCGKHGLVKSGGYFRCKYCKKCTSIGSIAAEGRPLGAAFGNEESTRLVQDRLRLGWSLEAAINTPKIERGVDNPLCPWCGHKLYRHYSYKKSKAGTAKILKWRCKPCRKIYGPRASQENGLC